MQNPHISLTKTAAESSYDAVNDVIHYTLVATNDGNVTLYNVTITDPKLGTLAFTPSAPATLAPGATLTATGSHTVTQSDLDAGFYDNTATAAGMGPQEQPVTAEASEHVPAVQNPAIQIIKTTNGIDGLITPVGTTVTWTYAVTNTGNVTLTNVIVTDSDLGAIGTIPTLAVGATETLTKTGTAVAGQYENTGLVIGTPPQGSDVTDTDDSSYYGSAPAITVVKTVQNTTTGGVAGPTATGTVGDDFLYTLVVTNSGNVALSNVIITDSQAVVGSNVTVNGTLTQWTAGTGGIAAVTIASLTPGQTATITYVFTTAPGDLPITRVNTVVSGAAVTYTLGSAVPTVVTSQDTAILSTTAVLAAVREAVKTGEASDQLGVYGMAMLTGASLLLIVRRMRRNRKDTK